MAHPLPCCWDIFCRVVDNFGDAGVCWRLARQLARRGQRVRLWVDALESLAPLCPQIQAGRPEQTVAGVRVRRWDEPFPPAETAEVVIEAFACQPPAAYLAAMASQTRQPCWINLEYLSAEPWVEGCHGLASPHPALPLVKHFFFPGFTAKTGGLLFDPPCPPTPAPLLTPPPLPPPPLSLPPLSENPLEISLFCYDEAPLGPLLEAWAAGPRPILCHVAAGKPQALLQRHFGHPGPWRQGRLTAIPLPFLSQDDYDGLLRRCAINLVRGEDSFVRAQWAARPFLWQIYPQAENAHRPKLEAFLARYTARLPAQAAQAVRAAFLAWNGEGPIAPAWGQFIAHGDTLAAYAAPWARSLLDNGDLAENLIKFVQKRYN